jgi:hypothetical protein
MKRLFATGAVIALTAFSGVCLAPAAAPTSSATPARVHFAGCVKPGVEAGCLIVETGGKTYNVSSAKKVLTVGQFAAGTGVGGGTSTCMQGDALSDIVLDNPQPPHDACATETHPSALH